MDSLAQISPSASSTTGSIEITALDIEREKLDETVKSGEINYIHFDIRDNEKGTRDG